MEVEVSHIVVPPLTGGGDCPDDLTGGDGTGHGTVDVRQCVAPTADDIDAQVAIGGIC